MKEQSEVKQSQVPGLGSPLFSLSSGEITIPLGLLWQDEDSKPILLLVCLYREITKIPRAAGELQTSFEQWNKTIGRKFRKLLQIGAGLYHPNQRVEPGWNLGDKLIEQCGFNDADVEKELEITLGPWVTKWACRSEAMKRCIHSLWLAEIGAKGKYNEKRRFYNREIGKALRPGSIFRENVQSAVDEVVGEQAKYWKVLMSPELNRCDRAARDEARRNARENGFNLMYEKNLMRAVWCFVQYECLGKRIEDIAVEAEQRNMNLPLKTLYDDRNIDKYFQPFYEALALYGPITKRPGDKARIDYPVESNPEKSGKIASEVRQILP